MLIDWYFDYISPFVHLQAEDLNRRGWPIELRCKPVLFAGLLNHWGQLGPAEIPAKRRFVYRQSLWRASRMGISMRAPRLHPFNPLKLLRLTLAINATPQQALEISRFVWRDGCLSEDASAWQQLLQRLGVSGIEERIASDGVKDQLRLNGEEAVSRGVFGVPTLMAGEELFWGADATDMCLSFLNHDPIFASDTMRAVDSIAVGAVRRRN